MLRQKNARNNKTFRLRQLYCLNKHVIIVLNFRQDYDEIFHLKKDSVINLTVFINFTIVEKVYTE